MQRLWERRKTTPQNNAAKQRRKTTPQNNAVIRAAHYRPRRWHPAGMRCFCARAPPVVFAALDHRLMA